VFDAVFEKLGVVSPRFAYPVFKYLKFFKSYQVNHSRFTKMNCQLVTHSPIKINAIGERKKKDSERSSRGEQSDGGTVRSSFEGILCYLPCVICACCARGDALSPRLNREDFDEPQNRFLMIVAAIASSWPPSIPVSWIQRLYPGAD
jgi:hypothetical protein